MKFELEGFEIKGSSRIGKFSKFDVHRIKEVKEGKHTGRKIRDPQWYDCSFEKALRTIIQLRMNEGKEVVSIEDYLKKYQEISDKTNSEMSKINTTINEMILANEKSL